MSAEPDPPRFALVRHDCPDDYRDGPHWDLMLERGGVDAEHRLATWSLLELPDPWAGPGDATSHAAAVTAIQLTDHRAAYLEYEGPVSGDRGSVRRVAGGVLEWIEETETRVVVRLGGPPPFEGEVELELLVGDRWGLRISPG